MQGGCISRIKVTGWSNTAAEEQFLCFRIWTKGNGCGWGGGDLVRNFKTPEPPRHLILTKESRRPCSVLLKTYLNLPFVDFPRFKLAKAFCSRVLKTETFDVRKLLVIDYLYLQLPTHQIYRVQTTQQYNS